MGRKSVREARRKQIVSAFAKVLANHGYAGATIEAVALEAGISPGLVHHHFADKKDLLNALFTELVLRFSGRLTETSVSPRGKVETYIDAALKLDEKSDHLAAKCWVGVLSEALRDPDLFARARRLLDGEISRIQALSDGKFSVAQSSALLAYILGALVFGAFAPKKAAGFAAPHAPSFK